MVLTTSSIPTVTYSTLDRGDRVLQTWTVTHTPVDDQVTVDSKHIAQTVGLASYLSAELVNLPVATLQYDYPRKYDLSGQRY